MRLIFSTLTVLTATAAAADLNVTFREGAPKDQFTFVATDGCLTGPVRITLDLSGSDAGLIFDVSQAGAGVEVSQPLELVDGRTYVTAASEVKDGDTQLMLDLDALPITEPVSFTIDLDDTIGAREITVSDSEIAGATVSVTTGGVTATGAFGAASSMVVPLDRCVS